jgi:hypothetical protein
MDPERWNTFCENNSLSVTELEELQFKCLSVNYHLSQTQTQYETLKLAYEIDTVKFKEITKYYKSICQPVPQEILKNYHIVTKQYHEAKIHYAKAIEIAQSLINQFTAAFIKRIRNNNIVLMDPSIKKLI